MIDVKLYSPSTRLDAESFETLWGLFGEPPVSATRYDSSEPLKQTYDTSKSGEGLELLRNGGLILSGGARTISIREQPTGLTYWRFHLDEDEAPAAVVELVERFNEALPVVYGRACGAEEYDAKHKVVDEHSYGWEGTSMWDFQDFLPGVYWLTVFGAKLRESFDFVPLESLAGVRLVDLAHDGLCVRLDEPVVPEDMAARLQTERVIAEELGAEKFFDRDRRDDVEFAHPPEFEEYLRGLYEAWQAVPS